MSRHSVALATRVLANYSILHDLVLSIPHMPMKQRKALLTLCRTQVGFDPSSRAYTRLRPALMEHFPFYKDPSRRQVNLIDLLKTAGDYITSSFYAGLVSMFVRNMPVYDPMEIQALLEESIAKELQAASGVYHPISLQWQAVLSRSTLLRHTTSLIPKYQPCPDMQDEVFHALCGATSRLQRKRFYPDYGTKTLGRRAQQELEMLTGIFGEEFTPSTLGLEQLYHRHGISLSSPTEVRSAFKFNDLRPRVYYARGPAQYYSSRYIQEVFNILVDSLPVTHRFERFLANSLPIDAGSTLFIYDYSAFTSTLHELHNFTSELACLYRNVFLDVVDSREGIIKRSLGDMLDEYNEACNLFPTFDVGNVYHESSWEPEERFHNTGMLGVPGNISSCTLLHGIHLICLLMHTSCKVVGDDAIGSAPDGFLPEIIDLLGNIGIISIEKVEKWKEDSMNEEHDQGWHYTKRPIDRLDTRVNLRSVAVLWPTIGNLHPCFGDSYHTVVYEEDPIARKKIIAKALCTFVSQFQFVTTLEEEDREVANLFIRNLISMTKLAEREEDGRFAPRFLYPTCVEEGLNVEEWINRIWYTSVTLPRFSDESIPEEEFCLDLEFECRMRRSLKLAKDLGYCVVEPVMDTFAVLSDPDRVRRFLTKDVSGGSHVRFCLSSRCPTWLVNIVRDEACTPIIAIDQEIDMYMSDGDGD